MTTYTMRREVLAWELEAMETGELQELHTLWRNRSQRRIMSDSPALRAIGRLARDVDIPILERILGSRSEAA